MNTCLDEQTLAALRLMWMTVGGVPAALQLGRQTGLGDRNENPVQIGFIGLSQISASLMPGGLFLMFLSPL